MTAGEDPGAGDRLDILLLCSGASVHIGTVIDHIDAFASRSRHRVTPIDATFCSEANLDLNSFDAIVFHYSVVLSDHTHIRPTLAARIEAFNGLKIAFIQDEYRWIDRQNAALERFGVSVLYTVTNPEVTRSIYRTPYFDTVRIEYTLTGFVPESLLDLPVPRYEDRPIDVSYRARRSAAWYGAFAEEKFTIGERFREDAARLNLKCDIEWAEVKRIYGDDWIRFVASSKATLGTESGVSFIDFDGTVQAEAEAFERDHPETPTSVVREMFLGDRDGKLSIQVISPRIFEAAALRTLLILYPGTYSGALVAGRHYVRLERDHSNMDEVVGILRSPERAQSIIDAAYSDVACNPRWWLGTQVENFDKVVSEEAIKFAECRPRLPSAKRIAMRLSGQWSMREQIDAQTASHSSYRAAHDNVARHYDTLAQHHQDLAGHHEELVGHYHALVGHYHALVGHYQTLTAAQQDLLRQHSELRQTHTDLEDAHSSLTKTFDAYRNVGATQHFRRAAIRLRERIAHGTLRSKATSS